MAKDANGIELNTGDSVSVIKDLKVKGASTTLKRGTTIKNIKLTSKEGEILVVQILNILDQRKEKNG